MDAQALRAHDFERILLIKPSALGDAIHAIPVVAKLRARYPAAQIDWLLTPENAALLGNHPGLSNVVLFDRRGYGRFGRSWSGTVGPLRLLSRLRRTRYDLVIDLHGQFRSALLTLATGARTRIGYDRPRDPTAGPHGWSGAREGAWLAYNHRIRIPTLDTHAVDRYLWLAPMLGLDEGPPDFRIPVPRAATERVGQMLGALGLDGRPLAVLVPGTIWSTKHWHAEGFAGTGRALLREGLAVVIAGAPRDARRCRAVVAACPGAVDLCGQTNVAELAALIDRAAICVTNDSGSMHLAVALDRPVVSVFGPTDPVRIGPYGRPHAVVRVDLPCAPCYLRRLRDCRYGHQCMSRVDARMVLDRIHAVLEAPR